MERAELAAAQADLCLAIGSTLQVYPAAGIVPVAKRAGARLVIVNDSETPFDPIADAVVRGRIGEVLPALVPDPISES
jgi:NAD-dependent deacetylase